MADLIDRDALIAEYDRVHVGAPGGARKLMVDAPRVDANPARHGHWIQSWIDEDDWWYGEPPKECECSVCKEIVVHNYAHRWGYCPNCGAKMDEEENK